MMAPGVQRSPEPAFSSYKVIRARHGIIGSAVAGGTYLYQENSLGLLAGASTGNMGFYFDPADHAAGGRTVYLRLQAGCITNATAPAITFNFHLYPVATWGGAAGSNPTIATIGASVGTVAIATPGAAAATQANSADFAAPAAGWYCLAQVTSGSSAVNSATYCPVILHMRQK